MVDWTHWHNEPLLTGTLVLTAWLYALAIGPWRERLAAGAPFPRRHAWRFGSALLVFYLAVGSPLDQIGERFLLSAHMVQHMIIVYAAAPLVLAGTPTWLADVVLRPRPVRAVAGLLVRPLVAAVLYVVCLSLWHLPAAYDLALRHKGIHVVQHLMFFATALVGWWPLFSPSRRLPPLAPAAQMLYVFGLGVLQMPLSAFLTFSRHVLYPSYEFAPRLTALGPLDDQILGGTLMTIGGMFIALGLLAWSFFRWQRQAADREPVLTAHRP